MHRLTVYAFAWLLAGAACSDDTQPVVPDAGDLAKWHVVHQDLDGALMTIWGSSSTDVWTAGGDTGDGKGPLVLHYDGTQWTRKLTGATGDVWWIHGFAGGPIFMGGKDGLIMRYQDGAFEVMTTPGLGTVFGLWGATPEDMWAVGGGAGGASGAFAWRLVNDTWVEAEGFPAELSETNALWKIFGRAANDVWLAGTNGLILRHDGNAFAEVSSATTRSLFTVHGNSQLLVAVGGYGTGTIVENDGTGWVDVSSPDLLQVIGVYLSEDDAYAVGIEGAVYHRGADGWKPEVTGLPVYLPFHAAWIDPEGSLWAAGGQVLSEPFVDGVLIHKGLSEIPGGTYVEE